MTISNTKHIHTLLQRATDKSADSLHICPGAHPFIKVNGCAMVLSDTATTSATATTPAANPQHMPAPYDNNTVKSILDEILDPSLKRRLQEGKSVSFSFSITNLGRFRANVFHQRSNPAAMIRILPSAIPQMPQDIPRSTIDDIINLKSGLVLAVRPSPNTADETIAAITDHINTSHEKLMTTIENPIVYLHKHKRSIVAQKEIGTDTPNLLTALHDSLREDVDIIMVGRMHDKLNLLPTLADLAKQVLIITSLVHHPSDFAHHSSDEHTASERTANKSTGFAQSAQAQILDELHLTTDAASNIHFIGGTP